MKTSASGRALIEQREGRRLKAYLDTKGILTIGVGHTGRMSPPPVIAGMAITEHECDEMLATDLVPVEATIATAVTLPLGQNEFDALASLGFNIGVGGLARSQVVRRLNAGDVQGASAAFMGWCKPASLTGRRTAERNQFLTPNASDPSGVSTSHAVATVRAATIAAKAQATKARAKATTAGGGIVVAAGTAVALASHAAHHGHLALIIGAVATVGAVIDALVAWSRHAAAATLAGNATAQATAAEALETSPVPPAPTVSAAAAPPPLPAAPKA